MGPVKKKLDQRIRTLIENGIYLKHRSLFVIIGDQGKEQIANLHYILSKSQVAKRPTVLWCYKKDLGFSSHRKKRMRQMRKKTHNTKGEDEVEENPFELFLNSTEIQYTFYNETDRILGNTFGMLVLQDFEALTPNILARTVETVVGGGLVVLLLKTLTSLKQFYTMTMDVHSRYRSSSSQQYDLIARFNERFLLSLVNCKSCLILDDTLNVLSISSFSTSIVPIEKTKTNSPHKDEISHFIDKKGKKEEESPEQETLESLKRSNPDNLLLSLSKTLDQAKAVQGILQVLKDPKICNKTTISITAARGRGKSAALGITLAAIISQGYGNIFVTAPNPENLKTLFEFFFKGLDALEYKEHLHYDVVQSINPELGKAIVRVNIFKEDHRQTVMYIQPQDTHLLSQAELVLIDEAAAIPLPIVQTLINGPYLVMMASTINGYEGTGRSLSLKLIHQLRSQASLATIKSSAGNGITGNSNNASTQNIRILKELELLEPIRYSSNDPIEFWLNQLLCLDATNSILKTPSSLPHPDQCQLYSVNRNTLFSYHKASETFLQRLVGLFVSSHYKNTPNDLQLMSDAPAHRIFVLLPPIVDEATFTGLPDILCAIHVCYEGSISKQVILNSFIRGKRAAGDLIPWTISQQFQDNEFAELSGARIVRIAVHPDLQRMGYGQRALTLLEEFYKGTLCDPEDELESDDENDDNDEKSHSKKNENDPANNATNDSSISTSDLPSSSSSSSFLKDQKVKPRANLKPLLTKASDKKPVQLHWLGVSFGLTEDLYKFWNRHQFKPVYLRQTTNDLTGEHTVIMLKPLLFKAREVECSLGWLESFYRDFRRRFANLLSYQFKNLPACLCLDIIKNHDSSPSSIDLKMEGEFKCHLGLHDLKRLESYSQNMIDYHLIMDLLPLVSLNYFIQQPDSVQLSPIQSAILLSVGLQHKKIEDLEKVFNLPTSQLLAMFVKCIRKFVSVYKNEKIEDLRESEGMKKIEEKNVDDQSMMRPELSTPLEDELDEAATEAMSGLRARQLELLGNLNLDQYEIAEGDMEWAEELTRKKENLDKVLVSVRKPSNKNNEIAKKLSKEINEQKRPTGNAAITASSTNNKSKKSKRK